jgi:hypothetical protein
MERNLLNREIRNISQVIDQDRFIQAEQHAGKQLSSVYDSRVTASSKFPSMLRKVAELRKRASISQNIPEDVENIA